jgi:hypothetical protein
MMMISNLLESFLLVRHPKAMEKLRAEIAQLDVKEGRAKRSDLRSMKYLQNVLKESKCLRLEAQLPATYS